MSKHPIVHIEFSAKDLGKTGKFYRELFNWELEEMPESNYILFNPGSGPGGGFNPVSDTNPAGTVLVYVGSDDIERDLKKAASMGGKVILEKTVIPMQGWMGVFEDPNGNQVALYTAMERQG